ncbi:MAG TPA: hypothetical protein DDY13_14345 [Cytophagales bacterium]|jgi:nicotinamide mononucleotide transporter|nr:hypothetical protein [Cytophagales bacterium]
MELPLFLQEIIEYAEQLKLFEIAGVAFGLLCVWLLIKENVLTWPLALIHVVISLFIYWKVKLYADFGLYVFYFFMNLYGWYYWMYGKKRKKHQGEVPITHLKLNQFLIIMGISIVGIAALGTLFEKYTDAALPYWDSATTVLSLSAMWITARKKIENWHFWFVIDIMAGIIYIVKGIYFYSFLYLVYVGMAVSGYLHWKKSMENQKAAA